MLTNWTMCKNWHNNTHIQNLTSLKVTCAINSTRTSHTNIWIFQWRRTKSLGWKRNITSGRLRASRTTPSWGRSYTRRFKAVERQHKIFWITQLRYSRNDWIWVVPSQRRSKERNAWRRLPLPYKVDWPAHWLINWDSRSWRFNGWNLLLSSA